MRCAKSARAVATGACIALAIGGTEYALTPGATVHEGYDTSTAGWVTDYALAIVAAIVACRCRAVEPFALPTFVAYTLGGLTHHAFFNTASDGIGMPVHYALSPLSWLAIAVRTFAGWGCVVAETRVLSKASVVAYAVLLTSTAWTVHAMDATHLRHDAAPEPSSPWHQPAYTLLLAASQAVLGVCDACAAIVWDGDALAITLHVASWTCVGWLQVSYHVLGILVLLRLVHESSRDVAPKSQGP